MSRSPSPLVLATLFAVLFTAAPPVIAQEPESPPAATPSVSKGRVSGHVVAKDGRTPVAGAVVRASHLRTGQAIASAPTDARGGFAMEGIPYGYVDLTVQTSEGGFVASQVLNVPPDGHLSVTLALTRNEDLPQGWWSGRAPRALPGTETPAIGVAAVQDRRASFFRGKKGIAVLAGAGALALLALSSGGGESPASPSQ